jgi:hypothetical protein
MGVVRHGRKRGVPWISVTTSDIGDASVTPSRTPAADAHLMAFGTCLGSSSSRKLHANEPGLKFKPLKFKHDADA